MSAHDILSDFACGRRAPVPGPLTYVEALGLQSINDALLAALRAMVSVPSGSGVELLQAKLAAHHQAHRVIKIASANGGPAQDPRRVARQIARWREA